MYNQKACNRQNGQLLLEVLLAISVAAIVVIIGGQIMYVSLQGNKFASERDVAVSLANETFEAVRSVSSANWQNIFSLTEGSTSYYPKKQVSTWVLEQVLTSSDDDVIINGITYSRSFTAKNVCRDTTSERNITGITDTGGSTTTCATSGGSYDPSTQRITSAVNWGSVDTISSSEYITRWMNKVCAQTAWNSANPGGSSACPDTTYDSKTNITPGVNLQLCDGGC